MLLSLLASWSCCDEGHLPVAHEKATPNNALQRTGGKRPPLIASVRAHGFVEARTRECMTKSPCDIFARESSCGQIEEGS